MGLKEYNKKRNFKNTPEPDGQEDTTHLNRFVIQRHRASHLHYDLRLEMNGVLKSWAIPKGPSMNPEDKRLAVATEDHPVKYLTFEGNIPKGNYGAGTMTIWDHGTFLSQSDIIESYTSGKLSISFSGDKIKGLFSLVKTRAQSGQNQWLLMKKKDAYAVEEDYDAETFSTPNLKDEKDLFNNTRVSILNKTVKPMLASPSSEVFNDPNYIFELKYDGYRCIAHINSGEVTLQSRNGIRFNDRFPLVVNALEHIKHDAVLDGEIVYVNDKGIPQFQELQSYPETQSKGNLQYVVFDLLYLNGHSTTELPLLDRKSLLKDLIVDANHTLLYCDHVEGMGKTLFEQSTKLGMEGIIAKKSDSTYHFGYRSEAWLKMKDTNSSEALICGYTLSDKPGRAFGSLILGMIHKENLIYVGNCGSGFSQKVLKDLHTKFEPFIIKTSPFDATINFKGRKPVWIKPCFLCEIEFTEWTKEKHLRHPVYKGLREDKEIPDNIPTQIHNSKVIKNEVTNFGSPSNNELNIDGINVSISNLEKLYWPESGLRKYDLIDYYIQIGEYMLPYLVDRPQNLNRHPNGIAKPSFYQKDHEHLPDWISTIPLKSKSADKTIDYLLCQNEATLIFMANLGCIEINPWHSVIDHLDYPDYTIIDLDPSEKNTFEQVLETALVAKTVLDKAQIKAYCKTSGSRGIHIYIPLGAKYSYKEAVNFTKLICVYIRELLPKITTLERSLKKRGPKIYLDYLQNRRGQTIVAPYSVRPKPGANVSAPVTWEEVAAGFKMEDFNISTMPSRIQTHKDLFKPILSGNLNMLEALNLLNE